MSELPIRSIAIEDFRRLEGRRILPFDAPIVLIHGPNGSGKTSVLSALELALTGDIKALRKHDARFTAHLPFHGQQFATLKAGVSSQLRSGGQDGLMTVGGSRIEGAPAFRIDAAQFYSERCYLDQSSMSQLLDIYQYRVGKEESALTRFVNELLGLEQLDALRQGLSDATDWRLLKRLSEPLATAEDKARQARSQLEEGSAALRLFEDEISEIRDKLNEVLARLSLALPANFTAGDLDGLLSALDNDSRAVRRIDFSRYHQSLTRLGGRIEALRGRLRSPSTEGARERHLDAVRRYDAWMATSSDASQRWREEVERANLGEVEEAPSRLAEELMRLSSELDLQNDAARRLEQYERDLASMRLVLAANETALTDARERADTLVEGLSSLKAHTEDDVCPVCDRDFSEISRISLSLHVEGKVAELVSQSAELRALRVRRDEIASDLSKMELERNLAAHVVWPSERRSVELERHSQLLDVQAQWTEVELTLRAGWSLRAEVAETRSLVEQQENADADLVFVRQELTAVAQSVGAARPDAHEAVQTVWARLFAVVSEALSEIEEGERAKTAAGDSVVHLQQLIQRRHEYAVAFSRAAEDGLLWDKRVAEGRRRQAMARAVHQASTEARAEIIERVFNESLNRVWRDVFTRLAPREPFVPAFGAPTSGKSGLELTLETVHRSGVTGGSPQTMLSAGNLNTAALSLFIALHLAVEPIVPCLVLDDPVQSMDEVHITQFAALVRVLSKRHKRQVVMAVHERELFEYLALELSPAYAGDELITIELSGRPGEPKERVVRTAWSPETALRA